MGYTEKDFEQMLKQDEEVYANLLQIEKLLRDHEKSWTNGQSINQVEFDKFIVLENKYKHIKTQYLARQHDYKTNATYQFGKKISDWVSEFTDSMLGTGLNGAPIAIPVGYVVGALIVVGAIAYFCGKYADQTDIDYAESLRIVNEVSKVNPKLADKMLASLTEAKKSENSTSVATVTKIVFGVGLLILAYTQRHKIKKAVQQLKITTNGTT